jgi:hypothetical protein
MGFAPHTIVFLARAARMVGALTLVAFFVDCTVLFYSGPPVAGAKAAGVVLQLWPPLVLYAAPGLILLLCARFVRRGRPAAAAIIFLIGVLSLFKLAVLPISPEGSVFDAPLYLELPIRGLCALLSIASAYAWWDLTDLKRTWTAPPRRSGDLPRPGPKGFPPWPAPTPTEQLPRPRPKRDEPPPSQTPWI